MREKSNVPYETVSTQSVNTRQCSCCLPLRIRCFLLGYLNLCTNLLHSLEAVALTTYYGVVTHDFDYFDNDGLSSGNFSDTTTTEEPYVEFDPSLAEIIGVSLVVVLIANAFWLIINIACLVGLHLKRPGPIRVYVGFAFARLIIAVVWFMFMVQIQRVHGSTYGSHVFYLSITAYYIWIYYVYAVQLERERKVAKKWSAPSINAYPKHHSNMYPIVPASIHPTLDKGHLAP